jgi:hypothetical protein
VLASDAGSTALLAPFASILVATAAGSVSAVEGRLIEAAARFTSDQAQADGGEPPLFRWVTVDDGNSCSDVLENSCEPRHNEELTMEEWDTFGQPQGETLICTIYSRGAFSNCRCWLELASGTEANPTPHDVSAAIEAGKQRAAQAFPEAA